MSNMPSYPGESSMPSRPPRPEVPRTVRNAVWFMYTGALLSAISLVIGLATTSGLRKAIRSSGPKLTASQVTTDVHATEAVLVVVGLIGIGLWIWLAVASQRGRNWARITGSVFFGLDTLILIYSFARASDVASTAASVVLWAVGLGAVYFLWQRDSTAFFTTPRTLG